MDAEAKLQQERMPPERRVTIGLPNATDQELEARYSQAGASALAVLIANLAGGSMRRIKTISLSSDSTT